MNRNLRLLSPWLQLVCLILLAFGLFMVLGSSATYLVCTAMGVSLNDLVAGNLSSPALLNAQKMAQAIGAVTLFLLPALLFGYMSGPKTGEILGLKPPRQNIYFLLAVGAILVAFPMVQWLAQINEGIHLPAALGSIEKWAREKEAALSKVTMLMIDMKTPADLVVMLLLVGLLAALSEELFFRGALQRIFIQLFKRPWAGILLTAIIFSAVHGQYLGFFPRMAMGLVLGAVYWYSGSIWPGVAAHFVYNAVQIVLAYLAQHGVIKMDMTGAKEAHIPALLGLASAVLVITLILYIKKISVTRYKEIYNNFKEG
jgi:uncharacterized protein